MIEVTNSEITNSITALGILTGMKWPVLVGLQVQKLVSKLREPTSIVDEVHNSLVVQYGEKQESGETIVVFPGDLGHRPISPKYEKFLSEKKELMAQVVQIDAEKIKLPSMIDGKPLQIEPSILIALEKFLDIVE